MAGQHHRLSWLVSFFLFLFYPSFSLFVCISHILARLPRLLFLYAHFYRAMSPKGTL